MKTPTTTATLLALIAASSLANAATIAKYNFTGGSFAPSTMLTGVTVGNFTASGFTAGTNTEYGGPSGQPNARLLNINTALPTNYYSFTTVPTAPGSDTVGYESFVFYQNRAETTINYSVSYTIIGGSEVFLATEVAAANQVAGANTMTLVTLDFADFSTAQSVQWRIYGSDSANATTAMRVDDVEVIGSLVPIPEPATAMLGALGCLALLRRRR